MLGINSSACLAESQNKSSTYAYQIIDLKPKQLNVEQIGLTDCTSMVSLSTNRVLAACRSKQADKEDDYGLRVYILGTDTHAPRVLSATNGLGDAYAVTLQHRSSSTVAHKNLILADASAEFAYGTAVYELRDDKPKYLGEIGKVLMSVENNPESALNATVIESTKDGFKVSFTKNVYKLDKNGEYQRQTASKAGMVYDGKKLR